MSFFNSGENGEPSAQNPGQEPGGEGGQGAGAEPQYISREDFEAFQNQITTQLQGLSREEPQKPTEGGEGRESRAPQEPNWQDYANKENGLREYNRDVYRFHRAQEKQEEEQQNQTRSQEENLRKIEKDHSKRMHEYQKSNPDFMEDVRKAGAVNVLPGVKYALYHHPKSAELVHYLIKNQKEARELDFIWDSEGQHGAMFRIGEIAARIANEKHSAEALQRTAGNRPPRYGSFAGAAPKSGTAGKSDAELYKEYRELG